MKTIAFRDATPIENNAVVMQFFAKEMTMTLFRLFKNRKEELTKAFGKWNHVHHGEHLGYVWEMPFEDERFFVFTGKRGTSIEVSIQDADAFRADEKRGRTCIRFVQMLMRRMKGEGE